MTRSRVSRDKFEIPEVTPPPDNDKKQKRWTTPERARLIRDADVFEGKVSKRSLFRAHHCSPSTGYAILKSRRARSHAPGPETRGRRPLFTDAEIDEIAAAKTNGVSLIRVARNLGHTKGSQRTLQRLIKEREDKAKSEEQRRRRDVGKANALAREQLAAQLNASSAQEASISQIDPAIQMQGEHLPQAVS